ncbi:NUDIX domain-containing protein [Haloterrigena sp. SYSU A121-1]|uniref:NUDIX domain-containing protein n=1 Tax=Haloterrigena gelatinilytica TaxID=2741724 RepID=A0A8J8GLR9_9EURY|nr:NUDIX domain-containing protein [Haloterrigena gelatinilytica]NUB91500.1 NUDIX domain-containing protein [Haloterrigena gelatinilytica]
MEVHNERIPDDLFSEFIAQMPEICVEIVVENDEGILLAKRTNKPVKDEWFWPGGRLYKGEQLEDAAHRIANEELGIDVELLDQLGVYSHFWETSAEENNPSRHTVNVVYHASPAEDSPSISLDEQHSEIQWVSEIDENLHEYVKLYLSDSNLL